MELSERDTYDEGYRKDGEWALNINSVVIFGRMKLVTDADIRYGKAYKIAVTVEESFYPKARSYRNPRRP